MTARTNVTGADNFVLQEAISAYTDEAYTTAKKLSGTGIVGMNPNINTNTETFVGQVRWFKPLNPAINIASLTDSAAGTKTSYTSDFVNYIKTVRTHGAEKVNMQQIVTQQDGLAKIGRDFAETRSQDEHNGLLAVLKGVAISEAINGAAAGSGFHRLSNRDNALMPLIQLTPAERKVHRAEGTLGQPSRLLRPRQQDRHPRVDLAGLAVGGDGD